MTMNMTSEDRKMLFYGLGFLAVLLREGPSDKQAARARAMGQLIEAFTLNAIEQEKDALPVNSIRLDIANVLGDFIDTSRGDARIRAAMQALQQCMDGDEAASSAAEYNA